VTGMVRSRMCLLAAMVFLAAPGVAAAHRMNVFAQTEGKSIRGEAYFRGGTPAKNVEVKILGPRGEVLGKTITDDQGEFRHEVRVRCDHRIQVETADGHGGEYQIKADELPSDLPLPGNRDTAGDAAARGATSGSEPDSATSLPAAPPATGDLSESVTGADGTFGPKIDALGQQIRQLQRQVEEYEQRTRLRDVLGGIGFILGLAGIAFYFLGRNVPSPPTRTS